MEAGGIGLAVVGLAAQLFGASMAGYNLLSTAQSFGWDYADFNHRLDTEKRWLEKWAEVWVLDESIRKIDPSHRDYLFAVATLARISVLFVELVEYSSKYGTGNDRSRKRDSILRFSFKRPRSPSRPPSRGSPAGSRPIQTVLDQDSIKLLTNPSLLDLGQLVPGLENEVQALKGSAEHMQKTLPAMRKLRWSVVDKVRVEDLIKRLKEYNTDLNRILPIVTKPHHPTGELLPPTPASTAIAATLLPFHRNHMFCGRDKIIHIIHSVLHERRLPEVEGGARLIARRTIVLYGLGGIGKSSIALEYSFQYSDSYTTVFWVDVSSSTSLSQSARSIVEHLVAQYAGNGISYTQIASMLGLGDLLDREGKISSDVAAESRVTEAVKKWLATKHSGKWLLILDNYDNVEAVDIDLLLPTCDAGNLIITSRRSSLQWLGETVEVDDIDQDSGLKLLMKCAKRAKLTAEESDEAKQIASKLGFLPLALTQAGSYISEMQISFQRYLTLLDEKFKTVAKQAGIEWLANKGTKGLSRTVFTTWEISFAALSPSAQELLLLCGFLANEDIPEELFVQESELPFDWVRGGDQWFMESLAELFSLSLAKRKASDDAFWIHPVVHSWARERLDTEASVKKVLEALLLCDGAYKTYNEHKSGDWAFTRRMWPHLGMVRLRVTKVPTISNEANQERVFHAALNMGHKYYDHGYYDDAFNLFKWALTGQQTLLGKDHPSTLTTVHSMASVFDRQGEYDKALEWFQRALDGYEKSLGKDHPSTLTTVHNMASVFNRQGEYDKALEWFQRALDGTEKSLGKDHPSTLTTVHNMASVFDRQGEYDKALEWFQRALDGRLKMLGNNHPHTVETIRRIASVVERQREYHSALPACQLDVDGSENLQRITVPI